MPLEGQRARTIWHPRDAAVHITNTRAVFPRPVCYCETRYQAERRDNRAVVLSAADPGALRNLIRSDYLARPGSRGVAP
jgi:hypothetical protein